jgi:hypothetical protein
MKRVIVTVLEVKEISSPAESHLVEVQVREESKSTNAIGGDNPKYNQKFVLYVPIEWSLIFFSSLIHLFADLLTILLPLVS